MTKTAVRAGSALTATLLALGGLLAGPGIAFADDVDGRRVLGAVHTDAVSAYFDDGKLVLGSQADVDGELGKRFDPDAIILNLDGGELTVPSDPSYGFLGSAGQTIYLAPQTQDTSLIWPGFSTQQPALVSALAGGEVEFDLTGFEGPSTDSYLEVFFNAELGGAPPRIYSTRDGLTDWSRAANTHTHVNWAFSDQGKYVLTFTIRATVNGQQQTDTRSFIFFVGDIANYPTSAAPEPTATTEPTATATAEPTATATAEPTDTAAPAPSETAAVEPTPTDAAQQPGAPTPSQSAPAAAAPATTKPTTQPSKKPELASTGGELAVPLIGGSVVLLAGAAALLIAHRRREV